MIGNIIRDLFTEDRGGFFEDSVLLEQLAVEKLERIAAEVREAEDGKPAIDGGASMATAISFPRVRPNRKNTPGMTASRCRTPSFAT